LREKIPLAGIIENLSRGSSRLIFPI